MKPTLPAVGPDPGGRPPVPCPECLTLHKPDLQQCSHCGLVIDWLALLPDFQTALQGWCAPERCQLRLSLSWTGGTTQLAIPVAPSEVSLGPLGKVRVEPAIALDELILHAPAGRVSMCLPGRCEVGRVEVSARLVASAPEGQPLPIGPPLPEPIAVGNGRWLGRKLDDNDIQLPDPQVDMRHCRISRQPGSAHCWIVDANSQLGTYVNRRRILACRLRHGDLIQVGPFAWTFAAHGAEDAWLEPVKRIDGVQLDLEGFGVQQRLQGVNVQIAAGELVAITGQSGSGKSTLVEALFAGRYRGRVLIDGHDAEADRAWFRDLAGYVSQKETVHPDLSPRQAMTYIAALRGQEFSDGELDVGISSLLRQLDLADVDSRRGASALCRTLSGGEARRVHTGAGLIGQPRLLFLDEPASGLDHDRERSLMRLLRTLSYRGCTIVVVTHNLHRLEDFDRVLVLHQGKHVFWGTPNEFCKLTSSGNQNDVDFCRMKQLEKVTPAIKETKPANFRPPPRLVDRLWAWWQQCGVLSKRELALLENDRLRRLAVPLVVLPGMFAFSLGLAVNATELHTLGFLAVLSCIWMGASLSLMSIVNERDIFEHERLLFLRPSSFVISKTAVLWLTASVQTVLFVLLLCLVRQLRGDRAMLIDPPQTAACLLLVSLAAVGLGLVISAFSGKSRQLASFVLPLVMMVQIVFSVLVAGQGGALLAEAYRDFPSTSPPEFASPEQDAFNRGRRPSQQRGQAAGWASYATLSRYGDMLLRSFAYLPGDQAGLHARTKPGLVLLLLALGLPALSIAVLHAQSVYRERPAAVGATSAVESR